MTKHSRSELENQSSPKESNNAISRRKLIGKYGAYTSPVVVSLLMPSKAYSDVDFQVYSTSAACISDSTAGHTANMLSHCMIDGRMGGMNTHPVVDGGGPV